MSGVVHAGWDGLFDVTVGGVFCATRLADYTAGTGWPSAAAPATEAMTAEAAED